MRDLEKSLPSSPGPADYSKAEYETTGPKYVIAGKSLGALKFLYKSTPGVGEYNIDDSIDSSSAIKRNPKYSFGI